MFIEEVQHFIEMNPDQTGLYLIIAKIIGAVIFFPGTPLTLLAGATLGVVKGTIISLIGNTLGALAAFLVSRFLLHGIVQKKLLMKYPRIKEYEKRFLKNELATVILLRLVPLFPFNALNYLLGVTSVSFRNYAIGTAVGIIPGTLAFVYFGEALMMLSVFHIIMSVGAIVGLIFIGKYYERKQ